MMGTGSDNGVRISPVPSSVRTVRANTVQARYGPGRGLVLLVSYSLTHLR